MNPPLCRLYLRESRHSSPGRSDATTERWPKAHDSPPQALADGRPFPRVVRPSFWAVAVHTKDAIASEAGSAPHERSPKVIFVAVACLGGTCKSRGGSS